ncbi:MAG TPA: YbaK/EbsC family protein [Acidobacteriota bacterium]|nr:YbaK/EbsC family protein [Acidobacteriota bacterium]
MGTDEVSRIKEIFSQLGLHPIYLEHEEVITSQDAAATRGFELRQGIKALLFTNGSYELVVVNVPADQKVDPKKVSLKLGWSKIKMCTPEQVLEHTGCVIGAVPPFGHKEKIQILFDSRIFENLESAFNIGLRTHSVKIPTMEMKTVFDFVKAQEGDFVAAVR